MPNIVRRSCTNTRKIHVLYDGNVSFVNGGYTLNNPTSLKVTKSLSDVSLTARFSFKN